MVFYRVSAYYPKSIINPTSILKKIGTVRVNLSDIKNPIFKHKLLSNRNGQLTYEIDIFVEKPQNVIELPIKCKTFNPGDLVGC